MAWVVSLYFLVLIFGLSDAFDEGPSALARLIIWPLVLVALVVAFTFFSMPEGFEEYESW